jgi:hypothetical protein
LEVDASQIPVRYPANSTQDTDSAIPFSIRDYHPLWSPFPGNFYSRNKPKCQSYNTTSLFFFRRKIQFAFGCFQSLLLTASRLISFPAGTKMFQFPALPIISDLMRSRIRKSVVQRLHASRHSLSQLATSFISVSNQVIRLTVLYFPKCFVLHGLINRIFGIFNSYFANLHGQFNWP